MGCSPAWWQGRVGAGAGHCCPASWQMSYRILLPGKDLKEKLCVQFPLNSHHFCPTVKSKICKSNHCKLGTICSLKLDEIWTYMCNGTKQKNQPKKWTYLVSATFFSFWNLKINLEENNQGTFNTTKEIIPFSTIKLLFKCLCVCKMKLLKRLS